MLKLLLPNPAAIVKTPNARVLLIADLHIGWEHALQQKGIHVPSQTPKLEEKLLKIITKTKPDHLIILGDVKYTVTKSGLGEWQDVPVFLKKIEDAVGSIEIVRGNHDANLEPLLTPKTRMLPASGAVIGDVGVFHGHKWPSPELLVCKLWVMGHLHPVVVLRDPAGFKLTRQVWLKIPCNPQKLAQVVLEKNNIKITGTPQQTLWEHFKIKPKTTQLFIMPSFNDFLGGRPINEQDSEGLIGPVLRSDAVDVAAGEVYLLDGTYLGLVGQLRTVFG
ncbi:MAG: metallophosphoesterase [Candidatus Bathyarchaeota archaeon]|nr:metallophosphoesterase [Candidatus Bathyarchaeota archaeon]